MLLASSSPRRRDLLAAAGFKFKIVRPAVAEKIDPDLTLRELTVYNAVAKAMGVARMYPEEVVLGADTLVALEGEVIGKPVDLGDAAAILRRLSGRVHEVCSAVFIVQLATRRSEIFHEISRVHFRALTEARIQQYLEKVQPLDKAGAYAAQGEGGEIIARVDGSFSNVVGLPMERTLALLEQFGIRPRRPD